MRFGVGLITCQRFPGDTRSDVELYKDAIEFAETAEEMGFDSVWVSEHHFFDDSYLSSVLLLCSAIAARTSRIAIGTSVLLAPFYNPIRLAEDVASLDLLAEGRFILGVGQGWRAEELAAFGVSPETKAARLEDAVRFLRYAWRAAAGSPEGGTSSVLVTPLPMTDGGPPIYIAGETERACRRAGRIGDGYMAPYESDATAVMRQVRWVREELSRRPQTQTAFEITMCPPTFAWTGGDAWSIVRPFHHYVSFKYRYYMDGGRSYRRSPLEPPALTPDLDRSLRAHTIVGTSDEVQTRIVGLKEAVGGEFHYIARLYWPGMNARTREESMRVFAEEVMPAFT